MRDRRVRAELSPASVAVILGATFVIIVVVLLTWRLIEQSRQAELVEDPAEMVPPPPDTIIDPAAPGGIARFEAGVGNRLGADPPPTRPLVGPVQLELHQLALDDPAGRPFLRVDGIIAQVNLEAAMAGRIEAGPVSVHRPIVQLVQAAPGADWNVELVAARMAPAPRRPGEPPLSIVLRDVRVRQGEVDIRTPVERYRLLGLDAQLPRATLAHPRDPAPEFVLARLTSTLIAPEPAGRLAVSAESGRFSLGPARVDFRLDRLGLDGTRAAAASGTWRLDVPGLGLDARARIERLRFADIRFLAPELPDRGEASFALELETVPGARTAIRLSDLAAAVPPSQVRGAIAFIVGGPADPIIERVDLVLDPLELALIEPFTGPLPYDGRLVGTVLGDAAALDFDLVAALDAPDVPAFAIDLTGRVAWIRDEFVLRQLVAAFDELPLVSLRPLAPELPLRGVATGRVELRGPPAAAPLELDATVLLAEGVLDVDGLLDLTGPVPAYDLTGNVSGVNLDELLEPDVPPVDFSGRFALVGSGVELATASVALAIDGDFTGWQARPGDHLRLAARLDRGRLNVQALEAVLADARFEAVGDWRVVPPLAGEVAYRLDVPSLVPFGPYLPALPTGVAAGAFVTAGTLSGTLEEPTFAGTAAATRFTYDGWAAAEAEAVYRLELGDAQPVIVADLAATGVETPVAERFDAAGVQLELRPATFTVAAVGERDGREVMVVAADGRLEDGAGQALVRDLRLELEDEPWALRAPALVRWEPAGLVVERFDFVQADEDGRLFIEGRLLPVEAADLRVEIAAFPVDWLSGFLPAEVAVEGRVWARGEVRGPAERPLVELEFRLLETALDGIEFNEVVGDLRYLDDRLTVDATALLDPVGTMEIRGSLPLAMTLDLPPRAEWLEAEPVTLSLVADQVPLEVVEGWTAELDELDGMMDVRATVSGTAARPVLEGHLVVQDGRATVVALNQRFTEIAADIRLRDRFAEIETMRARSDGWVQVTGNLLFEPLTRPEANLTVYMDAFRALGVDDGRDPAFWGEIRLSGPINQVVVRGQTRVDDGDFPIPELADPDDLALDLLGDPEAAAPLVGRPEAIAEPIPLLAGMIIDGLRVTAGDALWLVTEELRVQMAGDLTVHYREPDGLRIFGNLEGQRGVFTLRVGPVVRRFDIEEAEIQFFGTSPPDPAINFLASRIVPGMADRQVEVQIRVAGALSAPTLALTTPDAAPIPESELLSFIVFGQPGFVLGDGILPGQAIFETAILAGLAELATIELEDALITDLGLPLDVFRIRPGAPGPFPGLGVPTLVMGMEVAEDVFLTVDAGLAAIFGQGQAVANPWAARLEWRIDREWRARLGLEPVDWTQMFRGFGAALPTLRPDAQFTVELRRRWEY